MNVISCGAAFAALTFPEAFENPYFELGILIPYSPVLSAKMTSSGKVLLLITEGKLANVVANYLGAHFENLAILSEAPESKLAVFSRRARRVSPLYAIGQVTAGVSLRALAKLSSSRIKAICREHALLADFPAGLTVRRLDSVNSDLCRQLLRELSPDVIAVYGTRILCKGTLAASKAPFINCHTGITPDYRGQCSAYWALVEKRPECVGVTIHLIDEGVDTGPVLYQETAHVSKDDNITTYPFVQMAVALPLFARAIQDALAGALQPKELASLSPHRFPPTLAQYLRNGLVNAVW